MDKPTIIAVDDDAPVLAAIRRDLRAHYAADYRIMTAGSGAEALEAVEALHERGDDVALFLVDQRMPAMSGTEFLMAAMARFPDARRVLLTAYADTTAAIQSINEVGLHHYLMKPWDPPDQVLYPVLDDLLDDWLAEHRRPFEGLRVVGTRWSPATHDVAEFLARNRIPYVIADVEHDEQARLLAGDRRLPLVLLPDGTALEAPDPRTLADHVGLQVEATSPFYDLVVIGAGPAGLAAAVYGASEGLRVAVIERQATGGQAGMSSRIENYLGFPSGISGADLARRAVAQAQRFGAEIVTAVEVTGIDVEGGTKVVHLDDGTDLTCRALVVASGMTTRTLPIPGLDRFLGAGAYYGATAAEAASFEGEDVFVIGGANSAGQAAVMFSRVARSVRLVVRGSITAKMSTYLIDQITEIPSIEVLEGRHVTGLAGEASLQRVELTDTSGEACWLEGTGLFIFVGAVPHTDFLRGVVALDDHGFVLTGPDIAPGGRPPGWPLERAPFLQETSVPGIFAAGDVRAGVMRRVASAVGQGSTSVSMVHRYLEGS